MPASLPSFLGMYILKAQSGTTDLCLLASVTPANWNHQGEDKGWRQGSGHLFYLSLSLSIYILYIYTHTHIFKFF